MAGGVEAARKGGAPATDRKAKRRARRKETYSVYIYKVLKQVRGARGAGSRSQAGAVAEHQWA